MRVLLSRQDPKSVRYARRAAAVLARADIRRAMDIERLSREMPGVSRGRIGEVHSPIRLPCDAGVKRLL